VGGRADREQVAEPVLNAIDRDTCQPMSQSNANSRFVTDLPP